MWKFQYLSIYIEVAIHVYFFNLHESIVNIQTVLKNRRKNQEVH